MTYPRVAQTHDQPLVNLNRINPVPATDPVAPVERNYGASPSFHDQGLFCCLHWPHVASETEYFTLLQLFGLDDMDVAPVSIYLKNQRLQWDLYNGYAVLPEPTVDMKWSNFFPRDIDIYIIDLEEQA